MNTLKMGSAGHAVSSPEGASDFLVDHGSQHSCAALGHSTRRGRTNGEIDGDIPRSCRRLRSSQSLRVAIKVRGKILFINLDDVVAVQAEGKCVWLQQNASSYLLRESISVVAERLETHGFIRIHRSVLVNTSFVEEIRPAFDGRILPSSRGWKGIHGHPHLQEKSQIPRGILDRHGRVLP